VRQLNEYFGAVTEAIFREEGTVDKFIGDAVMAVFGAPLPQADHPRRAVRAALGMLSALEELNRRWREEGRPEWRIGVGIATGVAIVGNIGSARRTEFTVIGDTVNLASRLEGQNKALGTEILVSDATAARLGDGFAPRPHGEIRVKGKERPVTVYEIPRPQERR
jgi:adenylate cyclase